MTNPVILVILSMVKPDEHIQNLVLLNLIGERFAGGEMYETKIGHAHLKVRDLDDAIAFYTRFFSLKLVERVDDRYAFLGGGDVHHELALQQVGPIAPLPQEAGIGLYHIAFEVPDRRSLAQAYRELTNAGIPVVAVDHLISWAIYFNDPDGNGLEIYWDRRTEPGGTQLWGGHNQPLPEDKLLAKAE